MNASDEFHYLALGDSYTIGESVPFTENFPNQVCSLLRQYGLNVQSPSIVAKTGWRTDELDKAIIEQANESPFRGEYDLVTLLIGVNNQYQGYPVEDYTSQFESLLNKAIAFAGGRRNNVIVLSIPDWGVTPFAADRDSKEIADAIDAFNLANKRITESFHIYYINITELTRESAKDPSLLAQDGLHPSAKEYARWAALVSDHVIQQSGK